MAWNGREIRLDKPRLTRGRFDSSNDQSGLKEHRQQRTGASDISSFPLSGAIARGFVLRNETGDSEAYLILHSSPWTVFLDRHPEQSLTDSQALPSTLQARGRCPKRTVVGFLLPSTFGAPVVDLSQVLSHACRAPVQNWHSQMPRSRAGGPVEGECWLPALDGVRASSAARTPFEKTAAVSGRPSSLQVEEFHRTDIRGLVSLRREWEDPRYTDAYFAYVCMDQEAGKFGLGIVYLNTMRISTGNRRRKQSPPHWSSTNRGWTTSPRTPTGTMHPISSPLSKSCGRRQKLQVQNRPQGGGL